MADKRKSNPSTNKNISIHGDVKDSVVSIGDNNIFEKIVKYIFLSEKESLDQFNRRTLLDYIEAGWIKGVLDASLHGAAMLELEIKENPEAVKNKHPRTLKKESTDETLPTGTSMLVIFESIGMGRSLLILGAPGSGKTTMLLELTRQLIERAKEDMFYPIPIVFNLSSWTENLSLADWLATELNKFYYVPQKVAQTWVKENKLLLLLDGLDEVKHENRDTCVDAIHRFRKEYGLTRLVICSRNQDYANLKTRMDFDGAIEIQSITFKQADEYLKGFGNKLTGIRQVLKGDSALREMSETPLFLNVMALAYQNKTKADIRVFDNLEEQRTYLFENYINHIFKYPARNTDSSFTKEQTLHYLSQLARTMIKNHISMFQIESMQPSWFKNQSKVYDTYQRSAGERVGLIFGLTGCLSGWLFGGLVGGSFFVLAYLLQFGLHNGLVHFLITSLINGEIDGLNTMAIFALVFGLVFGLLGLSVGRWEIVYRENLKWSWNEVLRHKIQILFYSLFVCILAVSIIGVHSGGLTFGLSIGLILGLLFGLYKGLTTEEVENTNYPGQRLTKWFSTGIISTISFGLIGALSFGIMGGLIYGRFQYNSSSLLINTLVGSVMTGAIGALLFGLVGGMAYGYMAVIQHHQLRRATARNDLFPWRLIPFLDHCVDLIFLRRVGGGYIFVHRLLMEHFAEMYEETPTSKGN